MRVTHHDSPWPDGAEHPIGDRHVNVAHQSDTPSKHRPGDLADCSNLTSTHQPATPTQDPLLPAVNTIRRQYRTQMIPKVLVVVQSRRGRRTNADLPRGAMGLARPRASWCCIERACGAQGRRDGALASSCAPQLHHRMRRPGADNTRALRSARSRGRRSQWSTHLRETPSWHDGHGGFRGMLKPPETLFKTRP